MADPTPLEAEIRRIISVTGPMPVGQFVALCLSHPVHGYYVTRDPFGRAGDFTTAPEVSQMFGELLGLWTAAIYRSMNSPPMVRLVELGPGRGTMMRDALRALRVVPDFCRAVDVHLVEMSPRLQDAQRQTLSGVDLPLAWHTSLDEVPAGPVIILANEFLDALPIQQAVKKSDGWHQRVVGLDEAGHFLLGVAPEPILHFERTLPAHVRAAPLDSIFEWRADQIAFDIGRRVRKEGAALFIDYGHARSDVGDTLQAIGEHAFADPKSAPGLIDITAHVDFQAFGNAAESMGARVHGPVTQGDFLRRLGIEERARALKVNASVTQAADLDSALSRLTQSGRTGMGELFKVMAVTDPALGPLPGF